MRINSLVWPSLILVLLAGCNQSPQPIAPGYPVNLQSERLALLEADKAWSQTPPDVQAFVSFFAEDAYFLAPEAPLAVGEDEITKTASQLFTAPSFSLTWEATDAAVSASGDLGYTVGTFELTMNGPDGNPVTRQGKYTTVWRKQDGNWKVVADAPNFNSPGS